jgi:hypothetical protein
VRPAREPVFVLLEADPLGSQGPKGRGGVMKRPRERTSGARITLALLTLLTLLVALTLGACGGGSTSPTTAATPTSTPSAAGSSAGTSVSGASATPTTTAQVTAAYFDALAKVDNIIGFRRLVDLYAEDARLEDRAIGIVASGRKAIADNWNTFFLAGPGKDTPISQFVGEGSAVVEEKAAFPGGEVYAADVLRVRGGKIVAESIYYSDAGANPKFPPAPLDTPPAPTDTQAASQALAADYMSALRSLVPARLAPFYARDVVYQDTGRNRRYVGPSAAIAAHAKMYALKGLSFRRLGVVAGPGWAAVMWQRTDREGGKPLVHIPDWYTRWARRPTIHGVTILEIRKGKIARETTYSDHLRTEY